MVFWGDWRRSRRIDFGHGDDIGVLFVKYSNMAARNCSSRNIWPGDCNLSYDRTLYDPLYPFVGEFSHRTTRVAVVLSRYWRGRSDCLHLVGVADVMFNIAGFPEFS